MIFKGDQNMNRNIERGAIVKFREMLEPGEEKIRMVVLEAYDDVNRCKVFTLNSGLALGSVHVYRESDLEVVTPAEVVLWTVEQIKLGKLDPGPNYSELAGLLA